MKYGSEDLTGVPKHFLVWFSSLSLRTLKCISVARLKYIYNIFRLDLYLEPYFWHCSSIANICPVEIH